MSEEQSRALSPEEIKTKRLHNTMHLVVMLHAFVFAVLWAYFTFLDRIVMLVEAERWTETDCSVFVRWTESRQDGQSSWTPHIRYTFTHNGRLYANDRYSIMLRPFHSHTKIQHILRGRGTRGMTTCFFDPDDPDEAAIDRSWRNRDILSIGSLLPLLACIILTVWFSRRRRRLTAALPARERWKSWEDKTGDRILKPRGNEHWHVITAVTLGVALAWTVAAPAIGNLVGGHPTVLSAWIAATIGPLALVFTIYLLRRIMEAIGPRLSIIIGKGGARLGATTTIGWRIGRKRGAVRRLTLSLEGRERVSTDEGEQTATFATLPVADVHASEVELSEGTVSLELPSDAVPTVHGDTNHVEWLMRAQLDVARWPDADLEFELEVGPHERALM